MNEQNCKDIYFKNKAVIRARLFKYTKKAYLALPDMVNPMILDIGCGSGVPTVELVRLSGGHAVGFDINQNLLSDFKRYIRDNQFENSIDVVRGTMLQLPFKKKSFDVIWCERSISQIDFLAELVNWREYIKDDRFLILHDDNIHVESKIGLIENNGYKLLNTFILSHDVWWYDYYSPLERLINELKKKKTDYTDAEMSKDQREILMFKKNPEKFRSIFFIIQKPGTEEIAGLDASERTAVSEEKGNQGTTNCSGCLEA